MIEQIHQNLLNAMSDISNARQQADHDRFKEAYSCVKSAQIELKLAEQLIKREISKK